MADELHRVFRPPRLQGGEAEDVQGLGVAGMELEGAFGEGARLIEASLAEQAPGRSNHDLERRRPGTAVSGIAALAALLLAHPFLRSNPPRS